MVGIGMTEQHQVDAFNPQFVQRRQHHPLPQIEIAETWTGVVEQRVMTRADQDRQALTDIKLHGMMIVAPSERTFDGRPWGAVRGIYCSDRRLFVVGEELIGRSDGSVARHEFAHAYDHTFSQKNHRRLPLSVQLWNSFRQERTGLVSAYAATNPAEYFAESVEAFFQEGARDALRQQDPLMFDYLKQLFAA